MLTEKKTKTLGWKGNSFTPRPILGHLIMNLNDTNVQYHKHGRSDITKIAKVTTKNFNILFVMMFYLQEKHVQKHIQ